MKPERWQQLDQLFHSAMQLPTSERPAFLERCCYGDDSLRQQVEALLSAHEAAGPFMESPAVQLEARSLAAKQNAELIGQTIAHYEVLSQIGVGGMGAVYLAHDTQLGRKVALKLLPETYTTDKDGIRRFQQEARAASALNHPNIVTVYEIGEVDGKHFIATEFIDGETLGQRIRKRRSARSNASETGFSLSEVLNVGLQVADALTAAHSKQIIHRDIKPDNIILTKESHLLQSEGFVKLVDFGIAKLSEQPAPNETDLTTRLLTREGMVIGTAYYMSPEQARGDKVDSRTDVWSLGIVLYELLKDGLPFEGDTAQDVIASILKEEPPPLPAHVPDQMKLIVEKALRKNREERYKTAREMFFDLRELRTSEIEFPAKVSTASAKDDGTATSTARTVTPGNTSSRSSTLIRLLAIVLPIVLVIAFVIAYSNFTRSDNPKHATASFQNIKPQKLTTSGKVTDAAISPDGKYIVYLVKDHEQQSLWMKQVSSPSSEVEIKVPKDLLYLGLTFSPSGEELYLNAWDRKLPFSLFRMSLLGGVPQRLVVDIDSLATFSPDGKQIAYFRGSPNQGELSLLVANNDGSDERKIVSHKLTAGPTLAGPAWSPKTNAIAIPVDKDNQFTLAAINLTDQSETRITSKQWSWIERLVWLRDGSGLVVIAKEQRGSPSQIWFVGYPGGESKRITIDLNDYASVTVTDDSKSLVTVESEQVSNVWAIPSDNLRKGVEITDTRFDGIEGISWTPDGRVVYASRVNDRFNLWVVGLDGTGKKQLTANVGNNRRPFVSADGRYIVFVSDRTGTEHIWRMNIDGTDPRQLTNGNGERNPQCSPDNQWVVYQLGAGRTGLWRVPIDGGEGQQLVARPTRGVSISPDGKWIATSYFEKNAIKTGIYPFEGGEPTQILDIEAVIVRWTLDGRQLSYVDLRGSGSSIEIQPVAGGPPRQLMDFSPDKVFYFVWSNDAKSLAVARGSLSQDVILISNLKDKP